MRILYVVPTFPKLTFTFIVNEMLALQDLGHEVLLVQLYPAPNSTVHHESFDRLRPVILMPTALVDMKILFDALCMFLTRPLRALRTLAALHRAAGLNPYGHASLLAITPKALATARRLRRTKVDRIHAHFATHPATLAGIVGSLCDIPFSFTSHAYDVYRTQLKQRNDTIEWKLRNAVQVFCVSNYMTQLLRARVPESSARIHTVYVGIPTKLFSQAPAVPLNGRLRLLCVARYAETKGVDTLIEACALLRDAKLAFELQLFGEGPLRDSLAAQIDRLGLQEQVKLGGPISQEQVVTRLRECHIFVMPCRQDRYGDMDGIPTAFMEAMATGRPVISCPISGIPELVRDGDTGLLVPPNDPAALSRAMLRLGSDDTLRIRMGQAARSLVERQHDQRINAQRLVQLMTSS